MMEFDPSVMLACPRFSSTAGDVLAVLANLVRREDERFARDRRITDDMIERLAAELDDAEAR